MGILWAVFIFGVAGATASSVQKSASSAHRSHKALWADVAETLNLSLITSRIGPLGTAGVEGIVDGLTVSVTRPSPFSVFGSGTGDRIVYSVAWPLGSAPTHMRLEFVHEWDERHMWGTPARQNSLDGLRLLRGDPIEFSGWLTPDKEAALATLLADGTGRRRTDRRVLVEDGRLELVLDWRTRSADEVVTTTRRLIEVATVLWSAAPATTAIEPLEVHPLDDVAAAVQDTPIDATPSSAEPTVVAESGALPIDQAVAELLDRSLMGHEATAVFEERHQDRIVEWAGTITGTRSFRSDRDFSAPGIRATVLVYRIDDSPLVTNQVQAIVHLPTDTHVEHDEAIRFRGRLHRVDRTMRTFYVADATLLSGDAAEEGTY